MHLHWERGGNVYLFGGITRDPPSKDNIERRVEVYDTKTNTWNDHVKIEDLMIQLSRIQFKICCSAFSPKNDPNMIMILGKIPDSNSSSASDSSVILFNLYSKTLASHPQSFPSRFKLDGTEPNYTFNSIQIHNKMYFYFVNKEMNNSWKHSIVVYDPSKNENMFEIIDRSVPM